MLSDPRLEPYAILVTDMVGYSRWLTHQPLGTYRAFTAHFNRIFEPGVRQHSGKLVKSTGDGIVAIFKQPDDAESCARDLQSQLELQDIDSDLGTPIKYRVSVHYGNILVEPSDVWGVDVNITIHMQALAPPGGICVSGALFLRLSERHRELYTHIGRKYLKNISDPVEIYCHDPNDTAFVLQQRIGKVPVLRRPTLGPPPRLGVARLQLFGGADLHRALRKMVEDNLLRGLSRFKDVFVVSQAGALRPRLTGGAGSRLLLKGDLSLDYLLYGSMIVSEEQLYCSFHLDSVNTGDLIWSGQTVLTVDHLDELEKKVADEIIAPVVLYLQRYGETSWSPSRKTEDENLFRSAKSLIARGTTGAIEQARSILTKILNVSGDIADVHLALARAEHLQGRLLAGHEFVDALERARTHAKIAIEIDDLNPHAYAELALQEMFLKRQASAAALYERALRMNPYDPMLVADWADCLVFMGRAQEAQPMLEKVAAGWPSDRSWVVYNLCDAEWALNRPARIIELLSTEPDLPHVHRYLAASYAKLGKLTEAKRHAERVRYHQPAFSTQKWSSVPPYTESDSSEEYAEFLRRAGL